MIRPLQHLRVLARLSASIRDTGTALATRALEDGHNEVVTVLSKLTITGQVDLVKAGPVTDTDFGKVAPADGTLALDTKNSKLYVRCGGTWKSVTVT